MDDQIWLFFHSKKENKITNANSSEIWNNEGIKPNR